MTNFSPNTVNMSCSTECNINKQTSSKSLPPFLGKMAGWLSKAGVYAVIGGCFATALSTSVMGAFGFLIVLLWILSGRIAGLPGLVKKNGPAAWAMVLGGLFIIGLLYSPATMDDALDMLKKYRELFFIPAVMAFMVDCGATLRRRAVYAFFLGAVLSLVASYLMYFGLMKAPHVGYSLTYHITHSFFMAILCFWTLHKVLDETRYWRGAYIVLLLAVVGNIVYIAPGRTGMLTWLVLSVLFLAQRLSRKQFIGGLVIFIVVGLGFLATSSNIQERIRAAYTDIATYERGVSRSSLGMRFDWWYDSMRLISESPVWGHGTGSFFIEHERLIQGTDIKPTDNPHNEYLFLAVQTGVLGLAAFLALLVSGWRRGRLLDRGDKWLLQGVILSMAVGCLINSFLFDSHQGHYFAFLLGILAAPEAENS